MSEDRDPDSRTGTSHREMVERDREGLAELIRTGVEQAAAESLGPAAETVLRDGRRALEEATAALDALAERQAEAERAEAGDAARRAWLLRGLLALNLALMGLMFALPAASPTPATGAAAPAPALPDDARYAEALATASRGDFAGGARLLQAYVADHPELAPHLRGLIAGHIAYYLRKDGRRDEALEYDSEYARLVQGTSFPVDLWRTARDAERRGDAAEMRRAYAALLLRRDDLPPALKAVVTEACLALGDSYRAAAGEQAGGDGSRERQERVRALRAWQPGAGASGTPSGQGR